MLCRWKHLPRIPAHLLRNQLLYAGVQLLREWKLLRRNRRMLQRLVQTSRSRLLRRWDQLPRFPADLLRCELLYIRVDLLR